MFGRVQSELRRRRPELGIEPCYWGEAEGARLWHHGHSVPAYDATRGVVPGPEDEELALWSLLYQDRLWELRMLVMTGPAGGDLPPGRQPGDVLDASMRSLDPPGELAAALSAAGLAETFESARAAVAASPVYRQALAAASGSIGALRLAAARAMVAEALAEQAERDDADIPVVPDAAAREQLVRLLDRSATSDRPRPRCARSLARRRRSCSPSGCSVPWSHFCRGTRSTW